MTEWEIVYEELRKNRIKQGIVKEYRIAKKMGCGAGFWAMHCQQLLSYGIPR